MDKIELFNNVLIHHGDYNNRLYILKFPEEGNRNLIKKITRKAIDSGYTKVVGKVQQSHLEAFLSLGYKLETTIPKFYNGKEDCCFLSKFLSIERAAFNSRPLKEFKKFLDIKSISQQTAMPEGIIFRELTQDDASEMALIYKEVFATYPFPIYEKDYLIETMQNNVVYFGAFKNDKLISISSAEMDTNSRNAEMTDFAVLPETRGKGLSKILLDMMEAKMKQLDIITLYTIARLNSVPMNKTFLRAGYHYAGTLINNTNISGGIESMNVLYKHI